MNGNSVGFIESSSGYGNKTVVSFLLSRWGFGVELAVGKRNDFLRCDVPGFEAIDPICLLVPLLRTVGKADVADCTYFGRL